MKIIYPSPPRDEAYQGTIGKIVKLVEPHTEADPVAILLQMLIAAGNVVGRGPFYKVGESKHYTNEAGVLVGDTSSGRKGTAWDVCRAALCVVDGCWVDDKVQGGLSTGEGLIHAVRDAGKVNGKDDEGVEDKRLLILEPEFARLLKVMARPENIVSIIVRNVWDGAHVLQVMVKSSPYKATDAHISTVGHITAAELLRCLQETEQASGFGNRYIWTMVKRSQYLPDGGNPPDDKLKKLYRKLARNLRGMRKVEEMRRDRQARTLWHREYRALEEAKPGLGGSMIARAAAHVLRLSMLYAICDGSAVIKLEHLEAALALWDYSVRSVQYIWGDQLGDPTADAILASIQASEDGMSRTAINHMLQRNKTATEIARSLDVLLRAQLIVPDVIKSKGPGRPREVFRVKEQVK